jgi:hypothetical protein
MAIKTFTTGEVLTASDTNTYLANSGLVYVTSTTFGTAATSLTVSNVFSSTYDNYRITVHGGTGSTNLDLYLTLGASATGYYGGVMYHPYTTAGPATVNAIGHPSAAEWRYVANVGTTASAGVIDLFGPNLAKPTGMVAQYAVLNVNGSVTGSSGFHNVATAYTAFTLTANTGNVTGVTVTVYGYRKA